MLVVVTKIITYFGIQRSCAYIRAFCEVARSFKVQMLAVVVTWEGKSQLKFLSLAGLIRCSIFTSPRIVPYFEALPITEPFVTPPPLCFTRWWHSHRFQSQLAFPQHIYSGHLRVKLIILIKGGKCKERERYIYKGHLYLGPHIPVSLQSPPNHPNCFNAGCLLSNGRTWNNIIFNL